MEPVYVVGTLDVVDLTFAAFVIFFFGLVYYLRVEDRREGYPLEYPTGRGVPPQPGLIFMPDPKVYRLSDGTTKNYPDGKKDDRPVAAKPVEAHEGAPLVPTGNPMLDAVGPGSYAERADEPDMTFHGEPKIVPMRVASDFAVAEKDPDPRGMSVVGTDGQVAGTISDIWIDRSEMMIRYLEVELNASADGAAAKKVLLPMPFAAIRKRKSEVYVKAITGAQFADVPVTKSADQVSLLEEDKISGYYGGGSLYAYPAREEPWI